MLYKWEQVASILKNCNGYSLLDGLIALSILTLLSSGALPIYVQLYEERMSIQTRKEAILLLDHYWNDFVLNNVVPPKQEILEGTVFNLTETPNRLCVSYNEEKKDELLICRSLPHEK
ncbi:hypothetical protein GLW07_07140 [Bacillus hwajinpoensis]|uniref:Type II secretion system protein n=1 Tax=Guptibacillus hwajinpoensis TaxID=208199 RepID=A0A845EX62_9BACL|nr:hypothetical protein [Pseudalkalibacillus hwajinpoensis]MYL63127.1 hypothetical protein [Pseudalkalibacillus hwajinpoensis]